MKIMILSALIVFAVIAYYIFSRRRRSLSVYFTERPMEMTDPIAVCGTPDVVWIEKRTGTLIVGDYKSRASQQVYDSDVIQLSVYRLLLRHSQRKPVADYGFIHFHNGRRKRVKLMNERDVIRLYERYIDLITGKATPKRVCRPGYCRYCSHVRLCNG